jgi:hypothetical protein
MERGGGGGAAVVMIPELSGTGGDNKDSSSASLLSLPDLSDEHASLSMMTMPELKEKLWVVGLPVSGNKSEHTAHLLEA